MKMEVSVITDTIKKKLAVEEGGHVISVEGFEDWISAFEEIEIARVKARLIILVHPQSPLKILDNLAFLKWLERAVDRISFALLVTYPKGKSKDDLIKISQMKESSLGTLLTSKEKGLAEHITKNEEDEYSLLQSSLHWAINQLEEQARPKKQI